MQSKFRGAILGGLVGDCCGFVYELRHFPPETLPSLVKKDLDQLERRVSDKIKPYSDDTEMARALIVTFVNGYSLKKLAQNFTNEYYTQKYYRSYGSYVRTVFSKLRETNFVDPTGPAREQFNGSGSFGNGGAMRISPVVLYCWNNEQEMIRLVKETTEVTHTHILGINGALLQAFAIFEALHLDSSLQNLDGIKFVDTLIEKIKPYERADDSRNSANEYRIQLQKIKKFLVQDSEPSRTKIADELGTRETAQFSVPTAIYCFLRSEREDIKKSCSYHPFRNTLEYSISLGGDTDTIACMACSISGAYYGEEVISKNLLKQCEDYEILLNLTDKLYEAVGVN